MLCQPCDRPDLSPINPFFEKGAPHPTRARDAPHLAIPGSSLTHNVGDITRAIRGTRAIKATTAVKATTRARGKPQKPKTPANKPAPSRPKSGIVGSPRPGNHVQGSQRPGKHPTPLILRSWRPDTNPKPNPLTCKFKPDRSGHAPDSDQSGQGKLSGQQRSHSSRCSAATNPPATEPEHSIQDNGMEWSGGGPTFQVHRELETDHNRPLGAEHRTGPSDRVLTTTGVPSPTSHALFTPGKTGHLRGGDQDARQRCCSPSAQRLTRGVFPVQLVSSAEERWGNETCDQSEGSQPFREIGTLQNGRTAPTQHHGQTRRLVHEGGSERCIFSCTDPPDPSKISEFPMGGESVPVCLPTIWTGFSPKDLHEGNETSAGMPSSTGCTMYSIPGRPTDYGAVSRGGSSSDSQHTCTVPGAGLPDQLGEVHPGTKAGNCILRPSCELEDHDTVLTIPEVDRPAQGNPIPANQRGSVSPPISSHCGETQLHSLSCTPCPTALQGTSESEDFLSTRDGILQCPDSPVTSSQRRPIMVARSTAAVEWPFLHCQTTRSSHPVRRLPKRLGSGISGPMHSGTVVLRGVNMAHKLPGVESSHLGDSDIPDWPTQPAGAHPAGQHLSSSIHKPQRRNPLPTADEADQQPLGVVSGPSDSSAGHSPPRRLQHTGRPSISALDRQVRLEAQPNCLSEHPAHMGTPRDGLVCVTAVNPTTPFLQLEARSRSLGNRCVRSGLDPVSGFCESPLVPSGQVSSTGGTPGSGVSDGDSSMVQPAMVAPDPVSMCGTSTSDPQQTRHHGTNISSNATPVREPSSASRLEAFRESCKTNQLSESSTRLLLSSWRKSTGKSYDSAWRKWASWCDQRKIPPISCSANQVVDFLAEQFDRGMSYSSLNVYRSAISSIHLPCEGRPIGEHPLVSRVLRGAFTRRPPQPKHQAFWDVEVVLSSLRELGDNESLTLGDLSRNLAMLLALVSANRSSDLAKLSLSHCQVMPYKAVFFPTDLRKQDRPGHKRAAFIVPAFEGDALICPFQCLSVYIRRTSPLRTESEAGPLFISFVKPHKPVSSASLARWLKSVLSSAGIKGFTAHSTRGAGTSKAASSGLSTQEILRLADWSRESTFRRFYYKPVPEYSQDTLSAYSFSDAVLSSVPKS